MDTRCVTELGMGDMMDMEYQLSQLVGSTKKLLFKRVFWRSLSSHCRYLDCFMIIIMITGLLLFVCSFVRSFVCLFVFLRDVQFPCRCDDGVRFFSKLFVFALFGWVDGTNKSTTPSKLLLQVSHRLDSTGIF